MVFNVECFYVQYVILTILLHCYIVKRFSQWKVQVFCIVKIRLQNHAIDIYFAVACKVATGFST